MKFKSRYPKGLKGGVEIIDTLAEKTANCSGKTLTKE
jgi:hypothetical protein